ncbi:AAA family ATPase [Kribbella albertanoniae]|uniref:AAA family ATPase n=1 Tax=Kribbella albertanoniae TaxID=1266829 RepID=UPI001404EAE6|nr:AAA family ATPase [Kribbella albertanoniae]
MRFVERQKALLQLPKRNYRSSLFSAAIETQAGESLEIKFAPGITVLCGGNGAGKSTTLETLWTSLVDSEEYDGFRPAAWATKWISIISISGQHEGEDWDTSLNLETGDVSGDCPAPVVFLDAAAETGLLLSTFLNQDGRQLNEELLEGIDPDPFSDDQLQLLSYVLRRRYEKLETFEVTSFSEDDSAMPFFQATSMGMTYPLTGMGRGELCAAFLIWKLSRIEPGSIVFLEEPESHLATWSQKALAEVVTTLIVKRDLTVVASSHSPGFFGHFDTRHIALLSASPRPEVRSGMDIIELGRHLGLQPSRAAMILVEDTVAAEFCRAVLAAVDRPLVAMVSFKFTKSGESGVRRTVGDTAGAPGDDFVIVGVLDGDQKEKDSVATRFAYEYLPGSESPEVILRHATDEWRTGAYLEWDVPLPGGADRLKLLLERFDGEDPHDWLHLLGVEYGGLSKVVEALTMLLLLSDALAAEATEFSIALRERLQQPAPASSLF